MYKGKWRGMDVAVKQVNATLDPKMISEFLEEAEILTQLRPHGMLHYLVKIHPTFIVENVLQVLGVSQNPLMIVTRFYANGNLKIYLQQHELPRNEMIRTLIGIAAGMEHLEREKIGQRSR